LLFGFHEKTPSPNRKSGQRSNAEKPFPSHSARNKGMARKDTFRFFSQNQKKPYVSFALIASQASNIFFDPFITGDLPVFGIKKRGQR